MRHTHKWRDSNNHMMISQFNMLTWLLVEWPHWNTSTNWDQIAFRHVIMYDQHTYIGECEYSQEYVTNTTRDTVDFFQSRITRRHWYRQKMWMYVDVSCERDKSLFKGGWNQRWQEYPRMNTASKHAISLSQQRKSLRCCHCDLPRGRSQGHQWCYVQQVLHVTWHHLR